MLETYQESKKKMKQFIKTIPARHTIARTLRRQHGAEAYAFLTILLDLAQDIGVYELTHDVVAQECGIKAPKISRIFEDLKNAFEESLRILGLISKKVENISNKVQDISNLVENIPNLTQQSSGLEGQKPHDSTRDLEKNRLEEKRNREEENSVWVFKCIDLAKGYAKNSANNQATGWIEGYLRDFYVLNRGKWSALADDDLYACWAVACKHWEKGKPYIESVFERQLSEFNPAKRQKAPEATKSVFTRSETLMASKRIRNRWDGTEHNTSDLTIDRFKQIWLGSDRIAEDEFDPIAEEGIA